MNIRIYPPDEIIETEICLPLSKSIAARALIIGALSPSGGLPSDIPACDDSQTMLTALRSAPSGNVNIGPAGTAMRFLTAYYASLPGADVTLDGNDRMRQRPIGSLVEALRGLGADIEYAGEEGYPPLHIRGHRLKGGEIEISASASSQFISAILLVAPTFEAPLTLRLSEDIPSLPYIKMTCAMMSRSSAIVEWTGNEIQVKPSVYIPAHDTAEPDWSAASYWYSIAALSAGWISLPGLQENSIQGDCTAKNLFEKIGVITTFEDDAAELSASPEVYSRLEADMSGTPDLVQTVAVACCLLGVPFRFTGVATLRIKETDRIEALITELDKFGFALETEGSDTLMWEGRRHPIATEPAIETYGDHRMAMAFAPAALYVPGLTINNADVVNKSYPSFWDDLSHAGFTITDADSPIETAE